MRIFFYQHGNQEIGSITLSGGKFIINPPNQPRLKEVLAEPIWAWQNGERVTFYANKNPEEFIANLPQHYKSAQGLLAAEEVTDSRGGRPAKPANFPQDNKSSL